MGKEQPDYQDRITIDPEILAGKPVVRDTRIPVYLILNLLGHGYSVERITQAYPALTPDDIRAACRVSVSYGSVEQAGEL